MNTEDSTLIDQEAVARTNALVTQTGILHTLDRWRAEDTITTRGGLVSERAVLVGLVLLDREQSPLSLTLLGELLHRRLTSASRQLLDLPALVGSESTDETKRSLSRTQAAFHRMLALMDPYPKSASARSYRQISALINDRDVVKESKMRARLQEFSESFILMTVAQQPPRLRDANPSIDLAIDQFFTPSPMMNGFSRGNLDQHVAEEAASVASVRFRPVDVSADWYRPYEADASESAGFAPQRASLGWGWMINVAVRVNSGDTRKLRAPALVVAATLSMPTEEVADAAIHLMRSSLATGLTPGVVHADKAYFATQPIKRLDLPTAELGFSSVTDAHAGLTLEAFYAGFRSRRGERSRSARRVAGFAAAQVFMTIELAAYNLRVLDRFVRENPED
jgi:hypothetical protein